MDLTPRLLQLALGGGTWVLWLLLVLSVLSVMVMVERAIAFSRCRFREQEFLQKLLPLLQEGNYEQAAVLCAASQAPEPRILLAGLQEVELGKEGVAELLEAERIKVSLSLERGLNFLGTLGANAPFIGLFGTVLGIIHAFKDLALTEGGGGPAVMAGIAEALVATAVGLLVAIPAVVMYNFYHKRLQIIQERSHRLGRLLLAYLSNQPVTTVGSLRLGQRGGR